MNIELSNDGTFKKIAKVEKLIIQLDSSIAYGYTVQDFLVSDGRAVGETTSKRVQITAEGTKINGVLQEDSKTFTDWHDAALQDYIDLGMVDFGSAIKGAISQAIISYESSF